MILGALAISDVHGGFVVGVHGFIVQGEYRFVVVVGLGRGRGLGVFGVLVNATSEGNALHLCIADGLKRRLCAAVDG